MSQSGEADGPEGSVHPRLRLWEHCKLFYSMIMCDCELNTFTEAFFLDVVPTRVVRRTWAQSRSSRDFALLLILYLEFSVHCRPLSLWYVTLFLFPPIDPNKTPSHLILPILYLKFFSLSH